MLNRIHKTGQSVFMLAEELRKALADLIEIEKDLAALVALRAEDPDRHFQANVTVYLQEGFSGRPMDVEVPVSKLITTKRDELQNVRRGVQSLQLAILDACERIVNAADDDHFGMKTPPVSHGITLDPENGFSLANPVGKPMVGPGREAEG